MYTNKTVSTDPAQTSIPPGLQWYDMLADGTPVLIRPIRKDDVQIERDFLKRLSEQSRHDRFLAVVQTPMRDVEKDLTNIDYHDEMALIAIIRRDDRDVEIGAGGYWRTADGESCHCAVAVDDQWRKRGLGILLVQHLVEIARAAGVRHMYAVDAAGCEKTHRLAARLGFRRRPDPEDPAAITYELEL